MGIAERRARDKDALRHKIVNAAVELFLNEGYESVSMRRIGDKIEYSASTIYLYFKSKHELLAAICAETFEVLIERLEAIEQQQLPPIEQVVAGIRCYIEFGLANPHQYRLVFSIPAPPDVEADVDANQLGLQALHYLSRSIDRCREAGLMAAGDTDADTLVCWMSMHGITSVLITDHGKWGLPWPTMEALIHRFVERTLLGLGVEVAISA